MPRPGGFLKHDDLPYRPCVGIMLINAEGLIFVGRRIDHPTRDGAKFIKTCRDLRFWERESAVDADAK